MLIFLRKSLNDKFFDGVSECLRTVLTNACCSSHKGTLSVKDGRGGEGGIGALGHPGLAKNEVK